MKTHKTSLFIYLSLIVLIFLNQQCKKDKDEELPIELDKGLVAYFPFTKNANDHSGNNFNGTIYEAIPSKDRNGIDSSAFKFDGINFLSFLRKFMKMSNKF